MTAEVRGPVAGGMRGYPFSRPEADLAARGYVAEEFVLEVSREELRGMYASRDAYADAYRRGVDQLVAAGGLRSAETRARHDEAEKVAANLDL